MRVSLKTTNNFLLALIILVNLYTISAPFFPDISFWYESHHTNKRQQLNQLIRTNNNSSIDNKSQVTSSNNRIVIPSILVDSPILEGNINKAYATLAKGIWRWPNTTTPDHSGNTVLIGHRFTYTQPKGVFYFLNKLSKGDEMAVFWQGKKYLYKVDKTLVVPPSDTTIENQTQDARLTLFTCTPLWQPKDRLVVIAQLEESQ